MINILPHNQKKVVAKIRALRATAITLWALTALGIVAVILLIPVYVAINTRFALVNQQIASLEQQGMVVDPIDVSSLESRVDVLTKKLATKTTASPIVYIDHIRSVLTTGNTLSGFVFTPGQEPSIEVAGTATTRASLQTFVAALEALPGVSSVESPVTNYVKSTNSSFNLTVTFKAL